MSEVSSRSLTREILLQMSIRISIVIIIVSAMSYQHIISTLQEQTFDSLSKYITERVHKESAIFELAEDNHSVFKKRFINTYSHQSDVSNEKFWSIFKRWPDKTIHLQNKAYDGYYHPDGSFSHSTTAYIGSNAPVDNQEFRNRLYLAYNLVDRYSDAWTNRFANLYVSMPENVNIVHWPGLPWADNAKATLDVTTEEWVYITTLENNPKRRSVWTGLYFDPTADEWMVSCETPIDIDRKHLLSVGHDILLNDLFERVFNDHLAGTYNFILREDGRLIAHPEKVKELQDGLGMFDITTHDDPILLDMYGQIRANIITEGIDIKILDNIKSNSFLAVSKIHGPDWYFITVYPKTLLSSTAVRAAQFIFILGVLSLIVELLMLYLLINKKILTPLNLFRTALMRIDKREYLSVAQGNTPLPEHHNNEIGKLARTLRNMAHSIEEYSADMEQHKERLESEVKDRTIELEEAKSMAEQQARIDELTNIPNRRYFNEVIRKQLAHAQRNKATLSLCLIDIDFFKRVNDEYGHIAGDIALKSIAELLNNSLREGDMLARFGGEEFIISFPNTTLDDCYAIVERIRTSVEDLVINMDTGNLKLTISAGISGGIIGHYDYDAIYSAADKALYRCKTSGRNRVSSEKMLPDK